jgi:hypothetical protein
MSTSAQITKITMLPNMAAPISLFEPVACVQVCNRDQEKTCREQCENNVAHKTSPPSFLQRESKANISPKMTRCCVGVKPTTPGCTSPSLKKPPPLPRESSYR